MIFLESQRGCTQSVTHRSYHTFNFGSYVNEHRQPFAILKTLNDETLAAGASIIYAATSDVRAIIIPLIGACIVKLDSPDTTVDAGQMFQVSIAAGNSIQLLNPYKTEAINFLYLELSLSIFEHPEIREFNFNTRNNELILLDDNSQFKISIGSYDGRKEHMASFDKQPRRILAYVIEGAFEINSRLLHRRDGLALWNVEYFEFEALSNNAMILVLEIEKPNMVL